MSVDLRYLLEREPSGAQSTIGTVSLFDDHGHRSTRKWWTCEDVVREPNSRPISVIDVSGTEAPSKSNIAAWVASWKVAGQTAIPAGIYRLAITFSERFQRDTIQVLDVPGFTGIRVHPGNKPEDTDGCILPGMELSKGLVFRSRDAVALWESEVRPALLGGGAAWLEIRNATP